MKAFFKSAGMAVVGLALSVGVAQAGDYVIDTAHSDVSFQVRHLASKVRGSFNTFDGSFSFDPAKPEKAAGKIVIKTESIDTNHKKRDAHLRSADFFEVEKHPEMTYVIKGGKKQGDKYVLTGDLTMRGVTKSVPLTVTYLGEQTDPWGNKASAFNASTKINRKDFGLNWNKALEAGGFLVGDDIEIEINLEANPPKTAAK